MKNYCEVCAKETDTEIVCKEEKYKVRGEEICVNARVLVCCKCGEEIFSEELDNMTLVEVYNVYRKHHKMLFPDEIKQIREEYGLSQRSLAKLLNWGDKTIHRYENGALQDKAHDSLLKLLRNPQNMKSYIEDNEICIDLVHRERLVKRIHSLCENSNEKEGISIENYKINESA